MEHAVHPDTAAALDAYLAARAATAGIPAEELAGPLLATATGGRLDRPSVFRLVRRLARRRRTRLAAGFAALAAPAFATVYLDRGGNLRDLQDAMGHRSPATTRRRLRQYATGKTSTATPPTRWVPPSPACTPADAAEDMPQ